MPRVAPRKRDRSIARPGSRAGTEGAGRPGSPSGSFRRVGARARDTRVPTRAPAPRGEIRLQERLSPVFRMEVPGKGHHAGGGDVPRGDAPDGGDPVGEAPSDDGWGTWTRTTIRRTRICSPTIRRSPSGSSAARPGGASGADIRPDAGSTQACPRLNFVQFRHMPSGGPGGDQEQTGGEFLTRPLF